MELHPLISCLCVTHHKPELLSRAISCFRSQSYPNKELLILYESDDLSTKELVKTVQDNSIRSIEISSFPKLTLGELRNISIQHARGDYVCQWDDDDWYHSQRLELQMRAIKESGKPASILLSWIVFNTTTKKTCISPIRLWEGSILFRKDIISNEIKYEHLPAGEDTFFIKKMVARNYLYPLFMPWLYIYVFHGKNTFGQEHFLKIIDQSQKLPPGCDTLIKDVLDNKYDPVMASQLLSNNELLSKIDYFFSGKKLNIL